MATIIILVGSILGFVGGLTAYLGFDTTFWAALIVWIAAGPVSALLVVLSSSLGPDRTEYGPVHAKVA